MNPSYEAPEHVKHHSGRDPSDAGLCGNCLQPLDNGCECSEQQREEGPTLQEREENYYADLGEARFKEED